MNCCNHDCDQGRACPARRLRSLASALAGYGVVVSLCLGAALLLILAR